MPDGLEWKLGRTVLTMAGTRQGRLAQQGADRDCPPPELRNAVIGRTENSRHHRKPTTFYLSAKEVELLRPQQLGHVLHHEDLRFGQVERPKVFAPKSVARVIRVPSAQ